MTALDATTGNEIWSTGYPVPYKMQPGTEQHGEGPWGTPLFHNNTLYTLGISGIVSAFDAATGKLLWQTSAPAVGPLYGSAMSPVADRDVVIVHVGGHDKRRADGVRCQHGQGASGRGRVTGLDTARPSSRRSLARAR